MSNPESHAYDVIKCIPVLGSLYSLPRMVIYAATGNERETLRSTTGMVGNLTETGLLLAGGVFGGAPGLMASSALSASAWKGLEKVEEAGSPHD